MFSLCVEARNLAHGRTLLTCADNTHLIIGTRAVHVAQALDRATDTQTITPLGEKLVRSLEQHGSVLRDWEEPQATDDVSVTESAPTDAHQVILCGDRGICSAMRDRLRAMAIDCACCEQGPRECSYRVFRSGLLVVCRGEQSRAQFNDELLILDDLNISWVAIDHSASSLLVGPAVIEGRGARYADCTLRSQGNAFDTEVFLASQQAAVWGSFLPRILASSPLLDTAAALIGSIATKRIDAHNNSPLDTVWEIGLDGGIDVRAALPCSFVTPPAVPTIHTPDFLVDERYGIVRTLTKVSHSSHMPPTLHTTQARTTNLARIAGYINTVFCQGSSLIPGGTDQPELERRIRENHQAAIGESVERYCSNLIDLKPIVQGSHQELARRGYPVIDPEEFVLFSDEQYQKPGFPFQKFTRQLPITWVEGRYLDDEEAVLVPASLVYVNWYTRQRRHEPAINFPAFAGVAAGRTTEQAILSGLSEVIERHATMVWWLNSQPLAHLELTRDQQDLFSGTSEPLRPALVNLDNSFGIPVAAGIVHNDTSRLVHVGFSCRPTIEAAALKAWSEALTLQEGSYDLMDPEGAHWRAIADGLLPGRSYKQWRADRRYLDDFRQDFKDVDDLLVQQEVFLDPRAVERVAPMLDLPPTRQLEQVTSIPAGLTACLEQVARRGNRVIVVDITSPDVASCGLQVVRTLVPGTVGNTPAAFPYLGRGVVADEAVRLGWREIPLDDAQMNPFPMPHA